MPDIRPFPQKVEGLNFFQADAMNLDNIPYESFETVSALMPLQLLFKEINATI